MAYLEARSGLARAGVTYAGWCAPRWTGTIAGTTRTGALCYDNFEITHKLDAPSTFTVAIKGSVVVPVAGQKIAILYATPNEVLFSGVIVRASLRVQRGEAAIYTCACVDVSWLLDMGARPVFTVGRMGVNSLVRYVLDTFADSSFTPGLIDAAVGDVEGFTADGSETITGVFRRLAKSVNAYMRINAHERTVDIFTAATAYEGNASTWTNSALVEQLEWVVDLSQVRTRVNVVGGGGLSVAAVTAGASTIAVDDTSKYNATGGNIIVPGGKATYTGRSTASGPGSLTGVTGLGVDVQENVRVRVLATEFDSAAATALASTLGEGTGLVDEWVDDERLTDAEAHAKALSDLAMFGYVVDEITGDAGRDRWIRPGQVRSMTVTSPVTITEDFVVREVRIAPRGRVSATTGGPVTLSKRFTAGQHERASLMRLVAVKSIDSPTFLKF